MLTLLQRFLILALLIIVLAGCGVPAPSPTPTAIPTEPPTSTAVPPTATSVPTNTPVPPTNTPQPTDTPEPTTTPLPTNTPQPTATKAVTPKPTNTKNAAAPASTGGGVSPQATSLEKSMRQALNTTVAMISLLDQMKQSNDASLCQPLLTNYRSLHNAPVYDASGKNYEWQQAYDAYRRALGLADSRAATFESCGQGGGALDPVNWGETRINLVKAQSVLAQGIEWSQRATGLPANASLIESVTRVRLSTASLLKALEDLTHDDQACGPFMTEYNIILQAPTYDVSTQPTNVQGAYSLYRRAIDMTMDKTQFVVEVCNKGGGQLYHLSHVLAIETCREAIGYLDQALAALQQ